MKNFNGRPFFSVFFVPRANQKIRILALGCESSGAKLAAATTSFSPPKGFGFACANVSTTTPSPSPPLPATPPPPPNMDALDDSAAAARTRCLHGPDTNALVLQMSDDDSLPIAHNLHARDPARRALRKNQ
jgi:hypothetical protein